MISRSDQSKASKHRLCVINASSHIIREVFLIKSASVVPLLISQIAVSSRSTGILKRECAVLPPGNNNEATPEEATARTIFLADLMDVIIVVHKNVFPVPPKPETKYNAASFAITLLIIAL
ncbi:hypothetical protein PAHAL_5G331500 [Panicum hallii]|uniref:Uncharacterized protein n=1 Tax=Panicum hallii TaxID=206008 RepID=A0A2T8IM08_9POAL|nr:hypothetical protein PAHAL_5G331500 [Panicum hallii]